MGWVFGLIAFLFVAGLTVFNALDILSRIPHTKFGVMLIIISVFPTYILLKGSFTDASDEETNRDWNLYGVIILITILVGVLSLFFD